MHVLGHIAGKSLLLIIAKLLDQRLF